MSRALREDDRQMMVECASLYYEKKLDQTTIADKLKITQSQVSKFIKKAHDEGVVHISIQRPYFKELEDELQSYFHLLDVRVIPCVEDERNGTAQNLARNIGIATARYFEKKVEDHSKIGIAGGYTMFEFVNALPILPFHLKVYPLLAWGDEDLRIHIKHASALVIMWWAKQRDIEAYKLELPFVKNRKICTRDTINRISHDLEDVDFIIASCGHIGKEATFTELVNNLKIDHKLFRDIGVVGDFIGYPINKEGKVVEEGKLGSFFDKVFFPLSMSKIIQLSKDKSKYVILSAGGRKKLNTIVAAIRGRLFNTLITDSKSAKELVKMYKNGLLE